MSNDPICKHFESLSKHCHAETKEANQCSLIDACMLSFQRRRSIYKHSSCVSQWDKQAWFRKKMAPRGEGRTNTKNKDDFGAFFVSRSAWYVFKEDQGKKKDKVLTCKALKLQDVRVRRRHRYCQQWLSSQVTDVIRPQRSNKKTPFWNLPLFYYAGGVLFWKMTRLFPLHPSMAQLKVSQVMLTTAPCASLHLPQPTPTLPHQKTN